MRGAGIRIFTSNHVFLMPKGHIDLGSGLAHFQALQMRLMLAVFFVLLSACESGLPPVREIGGRTEAGQSNYHVVAKGETLYAISWRYGLDYREIGERNGIEPPYTIFEGQRLRLTGVSRRAGRATSSVRTKPKVRTNPRLVERAPHKSQATNIKWRWPLTGEMISPFSLQGKVNKGVDIAGRLGDSVASAADGVVVYAGSGLGGYGKLVIVKHDAHFLSAYGHNRLIFVKEGESVKAGQIVAEIGSSGSDLAMLHFEIRQDGKPKDPLHFLPRR